VIPKVFKIKIKLKQAFLLSLFSFFIVSAQNKDTAIKINLSDTGKTLMIVAKDTNVKKQGAKTRTLRSPKKAAIFSAILPGLGQAYNRSYWKIPIIYGAMGGLAYLFNNNNLEYQRNRNELIFRLNNPNQVNDYPKLSAENITTQKEIFRRYRDLSGLGFLLVYVGNILEASVDAHLKTYDMSDDLSLKWQPHFYDVKQQQALVGVSFTLNFKH
jgi:Family of unknown function (DUF5683)